MKNNRILMTLAVLAVSFWSFTIATPDKVTIDTDASDVLWVGKKVTGQHNGSIALSSGELQVTDGKLSGGSFDIDMTSLTVLDLEGGMKGKLEGHLKSDDFFGVETHPKATLTIKEAKHTKGNSYDVKADLTIKGITKEISFTSAFEMKDGTTTATADLTIDRSDFDVRYGSGSFFDDLGDKTIYDDFELSISLSAK